VTQDAETATTTTEGTPASGNSLTRKSARIQNWIAPVALACGVGLGVLLAASFGIGADLQGSGSSLAAQGSLAQHLSDDLTGAAGMGPSFWTKDGYFCRVFSTARTGASGLSGIACRERDVWAVRIVGENGAGETVTAPVRSLMENLIVGAPLTAEAERQLRRQGWRPR